jgi:hypothetical protein
MTDARDCSSQHFLVIRKLLKEADSTTRGSDSNQIVLAHLFVYEIKNGLACAAHTVKRQMPIVKEEDDCALPG